ncbi:hypothetical protein L3X38_002068 [Prunus dulcis]|uniref:Uncharacterized protein n=1 Tax=Prunus dulcis TaxID=3755 RepID=A0AAD4WTU9_PRUDU|nr:hypothetical protein L3X38_002068 [Prunus dulcis]
MEPIQECQEALPETLTQVPSSSPVAPSEGGGESTEIEQVSPPPSQEVASSDSIRLGSPLHRSHNIGLPQQSTGSVLVDLVLNIGKLLKALREILNGVQQLINIYSPVLNESGSLNRMAQSAGAALEWLKWCHRTRSPILKGP